MVETVKWLHFTIIIKHIENMGQLIIIAGAEKVTCAIAACAMKGPINLV